MPEILTVSGIFLCYARRQRSASEQRAKEAHGGDEPAEHSKVPFIAIRARGRCTHDCLRGCISRFFRCSRVLKDILVIALFCQCTRVLLSFRTRFGISLSLAPVNLIHIATILRLRIKCGSSPQWQKQVLGHSERSEKSHYRHDYAIATSGLRPPRNDRTA